MGENFLKNTQGMPLGNQAMIDPAELKRLREVEKVSGELRIVFKRLLDALKQDPNLSRKFKKFILWAKDTEKKVDAVFGGGEHSTLFPVDPNLWSEGAKAAMENLAEALSLLHPQAKPEREGL